MNNINKSKLINFFAVLAVILLLVFFNFRGMLSAPRNLTFWAASPLLKLFRAVDNGIFGAWSFFLSLKELNKENADLKNINSALFGEVARLKEAVRENEILRQQLEVGKLEKNRLMMANVIGYNSILGQYFLIDKGKADDLSVGLAVVAANNFLAGRVAEVEEHFSKVVLISDSNFSINTITQDTRASGYVKGIHGLGIAMEMIPIDAQINIGETVLTSGLNDGVPKGLIIGKITDVVKKANEIWQRASIVSAAEIKNLEQVFIIWP